jgi:hypothetical protein
MPLPASGQISMNDMNTDRGIASGTQIDLAAAAIVYSVSYTTDGTNQLGMDEFYNKSIGITFVSVVGSCVLYEGSGRIAITVSGGSGQYQYSYDNGASFTSTTSSTSFTFTSLNDGNYIIKVKSVTDNIIYTFGSVVIDCLPALAGTFVSSCDTSGIGTINITATGGSGNYSYRITRTSDGTNTIQSFNVFTNLGSFDTYNVLGIVYSDLCFKYYY